MEEGFTSNFLFIIKIMKIFRDLFVLLLSFCNIHLISSVCSNNIADPPSVMNGNRNTQKTIYSEDGSLNFTELAKKYLGSGEEYDVTTEDGYILKLFHIPGNTCNVVLLCPGVLVTPDNFLIRGKTSLIYMMAKQGFDVWAMSYRGLRYSRRHVKLNPDTDPKFWQFSMQEIGIYDYKAIIDFVLATTGQEQLSVVAHSEGTSAFFVLTSERPEYNKKIKVIAALAPICYLHYIGPTLTAIIKSEPVLNPILIKLGKEELLGYYSREKQATDIIFSQGILGYELFFNIVGSVTGFNPKNIESGFTTTVLGHFTAGSSRKNLIHFVHVYQHNNFVKFDYGLENLSVYGSPTPPAYDLKKVTTKVAMFAGKSDIISTMKDVERLRLVLPNVVHFHVIKDAKFNHIDHMWGLNAHTMLYPYVIDILFKYR